MRLSTSLSLFHSPAAVTWVCRGGKDDTPLQLQCGVYDGAGCTDFFVLKMRFCTGYRHVRVICICWVYARKYGTHIHHMTTLRPSLILKLLRTEWRLRTNHRTPYPMIWDNTFRSYFAQIWRVGHCLTSHCTLMKPQPQHDKWRNKWTFILVSGQTDLTELFWCTLTQPSCDMLNTHVLKKK